MNKDIVSPNFPDESEDGGKTQETANPMEAWGDLAFIDHNQSNEENISSGPTSITEIRWRHTDESPEDTPQNPLSYEKPTPEVNITANLVDMANDIRNNNPYINKILSNINQFQSWNVLRIENWTKLPDEVNALVILLEKSGVNRDSNDLSQVIGITYSELRKADIDKKSHNWRGIKPSGFNSGPATDLIRDLAKLPELTEGQFDAAVISSLACGEPMVAMQLIKNANKLFRNDLKAVDNALSRLTNGKEVKSIFDFAYDLYPKDLKEKFDYVMSTIGEEDKRLIPPGYRTEVTFGLESLKEHPLALELKAKSEGNLTAQLRSKQNEWYALQEIVPIGKREERYFGDQSLLAVVKAPGESSNNENPKSRLEKQIAEGSQSIQEGIVANLIAAELSRRMLVDQNREHTIQIRKKKELGISDGNMTIEPYMSGNVVDNYLGNPNNDLSLDEKRQLIKNVKFEYLEFPRSIIFPNNAESINKISTHLILLLTNPSGYVASYKNHMREFQNNQYIKEKQTHARRLAGSIEFLETVSNNPKLKIVLEKEFGFPDLDEKAFENARTALTSLLPGENEEEKKGFYQSLIGSEGQLDEDHRTTEQLALLMTKEIEKRNQEYQLQIPEKVGQVISKEIARLEEQRAEITAITAPLSNRERTASGITVLRNFIDELENKLLTQEGLAEKSLFNRQGIPKKEKETMIFGTRHKIGVAKTDLAKNEALLAERGGELSEVESNLLRIKSQELHQLIESRDYLSRMKKILTNTG